MKPLIVIIVVALIAVSGFVFMRHQKTSDTFADWNGVIRGVLAGGQGLVIEPASGGPLVEAYLAGGATASVTNGPVHIHGRQTGISCAYLATIFGRCHPEVEVTQLESLMRISSPAFEDGASIPVQYTCDGQGMPPPLTVSDVPADAVSLKLVVTDPDAPQGTFTHWVVEDIAPTTASISGPGYKPPCPPSGTHRYIFTLTALDADGATIATAQLTGIYAHSRP